MIQGTTPAGAQTEEQAARWVRDMFGRIAPRYDLLNHLLSFQIDRYWRAHTVKRVESVLLRPGARALDVCCGTGDLLLALKKRAPTRNVWGSDFSHPMLVAAQSKTGCSLFEADALALPLPEASLDLITIAFGFRNLVNYRQGLSEFLRLLRPGGLLAILEFSQPSNLFLSAAYGFYSKTVLPAVGGLISGSRDAYTYLPESVRRFPGPHELVQEMLGAGFARAEFEPLTGGIAAVHLGWADIKVP